ncbi:MAG TPA: serine hydrolase domain-containing protein [Candidatus Angelobacter sp.]|nr:serine hydrolase domain-containing protein [Candidatus Angelobacter sp.]
MDLAAAAALSDDRFRTIRAEQGVPAVAYGLVKDGELVHSAGFGEVAVGTGRVPGPDDVFRIASMTKSFTASTVLLLRDRGLLRLDDPVSAYLPWTEGLRPPDGGPAITVRDLLSMDAGLPTDDPWGDRHESLPVDDFDALVRGGISFARTPRTGFEYSNLGYALLGRIVTVAAGKDYRDVVQRELLVPLGMTSTRFDAREVPPDRLVPGYAAVESGLVPEPVVGPGAFSPMGGLHSTVRDLATWVAGFQASWRGGSDHPLPRWSRREMQEQQSYVGAAVAPASDDVPERVVSTSYGFGLFVEDDRRLGRFVSHSGGYPGFGSHMRWHPESGWGVVALGNRTYARLGKVGAELLAAVIERHGAAYPRDVAASLWPRTRAAMDVVEALLESWDDALADAWLAPNVDLDRPRAERRTELERLRARVGRVTRASSRPVESTSPASARWWLDSADGTAVWAEVLLSPDRVPMIQSFTVSTEPPPPRP